MAFLFCGLCPPLRSGWPGGFFWPAKPDMSKPWEAESTALQRTPLPSLIQRGKTPKYYPHSSIDWETAFYVFNRG